MLRNLLLVIGLPLVLFFGMWAMISNQTAAKKEEQVYSDYIQYFVDNKVEKYTLDLGTGKLMLSLREQYRTDVNKDGKVDALDAAKILIAIAANETIDVKVGDYNADGAVNALDAAKILQDVAAGVLK